jgi:HD-GYP domain-containing protein (c-di-GMP phosphodiesterase class II)
MAKKRISISSVKVGMYLCGIDRSWLDTPFLRHRFLIRSPEDLTKLFQCGIQEITIDTERGLDDTSTTAETEHQEETAPRPPLDPPRVKSKASISPQEARIQHLPEEVQGKSLGGELTSIAQTRQYMLEGVQDILETLAKTGGLAVEQVNHVTQSIMADTLDHEEAYIALIRTREYSPALYDHALAVSTLSVLLGRAVGLEDSECQDLAIAGLLHDSGLAKIPQDIHRPLHDLSDSELGIYQSHPKRGLDFLMQQSTLSEQVQTYIREHHVALDGSGYPANIDPATIKPASRILRLVDEYDELLSGHQSGKPQTVRGALQSLYQQGKKGMLDAELVGKFINLIGIYPTYSLVELSTGERGIVTANSRENLLHPTILLIQDAAHQPLPEPIPFNFSVLGSESPSPEIVKIVAPEEAGIQLSTALEDWVTL